MVGTSYESRYGARRSERLDSQGPEGDAVAVVLNADVALGRLGKVRHRPELAGGNHLIPLWTALLVFEHLHAVEPVLDAVALDADHSVVPLADRAGDVFPGGDEAVEGSGAGLGVAPVGMLGVVENLILRAGVPRVRMLLRDEIHDAAVGPGVDLPLEPEFKLIELVHGDDVAARSDPGDRAVDDLPAVGNVLLAEAAPAVERLAVEKRPEALGLLRVSQGLRLVGLDHDGQEQRESGNQQRAMSDHVNLSGSGGWGGAEGTAPLAGILTSLGRGCH
ncbi:MAG TPA: hypothetical protein PKD86_18840 [Gemmatales bacterium]|nr:hypothetical protein [Gemmatales bacterium]